MTTGAKNTSRQPTLVSRFEYCLSPLGSTLLATIQALVSWTEAHQQEIADARAAFDTANPAAVAASR